MKTCSKCKLEKSLEAFGKNRSAKDGLHHYCRECAREKNDTWAKAHPEQTRASAKKYREANREKLRIDSLDRFYRNHDVCLVRGREWAKNNSDKVREYGRKHDAKPHRKHQRGDYKARQSKWYWGHLEEARASRIAYQAKRRQDPAERLVDAVRRRIRSVVRGQSKGAIKLLGYSADDLRNRLEVQFQPGMTWNNYGLYGEKWHVDHIRPVSSFKFPDQLVECFALSNLQPLWARDNLSKHARM
jgi:hypothetical protein